MGGEVLHVRCCAPILSLIVTDGLKDIRESVARVRSVVRFVRSSSARLKKFKTLLVLRAFNVRRCVCLDVHTR